MKNNKYLFTSESVSEGHPDKVCDRISDMVVDSYLSKDPVSRVACETLTTTNKVVLAGETRGPKIDKEEFHKHFIDSDFYDKYPFDNIPKNYSTLVSKYGEDNIKKYGIAPWTIKETSDRIIDLLKRNQFEEAVYNMGVLGHYISDLHMPLHTVINYDGQFSGNEGIHKRWELHLVNKYIKNIKPVGEIETVEDPWTFSMKIVKESFKAHHLILEADTKARKLLTKEQAEKLKSYETLSFEKPYLDVLFAETGDLLRDRLGRAVIRLASIWKYCWEEAGKPELP